MSKWICLREWKKYVFFFFLKSGVFKLLVLSNSLKQNYITEDKQKQIWEVWITKKGAN